MWFGAIVRAAGGGMFFLEDVPLVTSLRSLIAAVTVVLTAAMSGNAFAQMPVMAQVALTPEIVEAFIASYPAVRQTAPGLSRVYGVAGGGGGGPPAGRGA